MQNGYDMIHWWPYGTIDEGRCRDGKRHSAHSILMAIDRLRHEGSWANKAIDEGGGVVMYPKGQVYDGTRVAGRRQGRGTMIRFTNGGCLW